MPTPDVFDYACAAAKLHVDDRMDFVTDPDLVLGPLFITGTMPRQPDLERYLQYHFADASLTIQDLRRMITHGVYGLTRRFKTELLQVHGTRENAVFTLDHALVTNPSPEMVQRIVRLAAMRVLADTYSDTQADFVDILRQDVQCSDFEAQVLCDLLERHGEVIYFNRYMQNNPHSRQQLRNFARRINLHYKKEMIDVTKDRNGICATPPFLKLSGSFSTQNIVDEHTADFGPYIPVPQLLLHTDTQPADQNVPYKIKAIEKAIFHLSSMKDVINCQALLVDLARMLHVLRKRRDESQRPHNGIDIRRHNGTPKNYADAPEVGEALFHFGTLSEPAQATEPASVVVEERRGNVVRRRTVPLMTN